MLKHIRTCVRPGRGLAIPVVLIAVGFLGLFVAAFQDLGGVGTRSALLYGLGYLAGCLVTWWRQSHNQRGGARSPA